MEVMSSKRPDRYDDLIDSRDVIQTLDELQAQADVNWSEKFGDEAIKPADWDAAQWLDEDEDPDYYEALVTLAAEADGSPDWRYGETLIRDSYFQDYAQELAEEIGAIPADNKWPTYCIDWEWAVRELQVDYSTVDFGGVTYWIRS